MTADTKKYVRNYRLSQKLYTIGRCWDPICYGKTYRKRTWQKLWAPSPNGKRTRKFVWYRREVRECSRCSGQYVDRSCQKWNDVEYRAACKAVTKEKKDDADRPVELISRW